MVHTNKVLTVSYGTFSCTLEGFEDSFGTMKAIAEYFRDLAADDRYFGAEPPQPDADMLARIAQKEISRRVEAHTDGSGIVLRACAVDRVPDAEPSAVTTVVDAATTHAAAEAQPARPVQADSAQGAPSSIAVDESAGTKDVNDDIDAHAPQDQPAAGAATEDAHIVDLIDAETPAGEPAVVETAGDAQPTDASVGEDTTVEDTGDDRGATASADSFFAGARETAATDLTGKGEPEDLRAFEETVDTATAHPAASDAEPAEETPDPDSITAKLQRIRDVVARGGVAIQEGTEPDTGEEDTLLASVAAANVAPGASPSGAVAPQAPVQIPGQIDTAVGTAVDAAQETLEAAIDMEVKIAVQTATAGTHDDDQADHEEQGADILNEAAREISAALADTLGKTAQEAVDEPNAEADAAGDWAAEHPEPLSATAEDEAQAGNDPDDLAFEGLDERDAEHGAGQTPEVRPFDLATFESVAAEARSEEDAEPREPEHKATDTDHPEAASLDATNEGQDTIFAGLDEDEDEDEDDSVENILADDARETPVHPAPPSGRGRVVKVRRSDLENAIERGEIEAIEEGEEEPAAASELSPEDEADLLRELAQVVEDGAASVVAQPEEDMPRLLIEAGEKMKDQESIANREAFAQLRAAVAATKAEEKVSGKPPMLMLDKEYRDDLAQVVRPARPLTSPPTAQDAGAPAAAREDRASAPEARPEEARTALQQSAAKAADAGSAQVQDRRRSRPTTRRPSSDLAAPLKLVAEQRVDQGDDKPRGPVRPRRVTTQILDQDMPDDVDEPADGFAAFAEKVGATGLSELLEAAAAYMSYVEGRDQFSRPQLMTKVRQVEKDDFNREDGLRSFGQLLRQGKISKTGSGRFTAAPDIGFRPDQRAAS